MNGGSQRTFRDVHDAGALGLADLVPLDHAVSRLRLRADRQVVEGSGVAQPEQRLSFERLEQLGIVPLGMFEHRRRQDQDLRRRRTIRADAHPRVVEVRMHRERDVRRKRPRRRGPGEEGLCL